MSSLAGRSTTTLSSTSSSNGSSERKSHFIIDGAAKLELLSELSLEPLVKRSRLSSGTKTINTTTKPSLIKVTQLHNEIQRLEDIYFGGNNPHLYKSKPATRHSDYNNDYESSVHTNDEDVLMSQLVSITPGDDAISSLLIEKLKKDVHELKVIRRHNRISHQSLSFAEGWRTKEIAIVRQYCTLIGRKA